MMKSGNPGTTRILLSGLVTKLGSLLGCYPDVLGFGLKYSDALIYASRAAQVFLMAAALLAGGIIVRQATRSSIAAMMFQIAPFVRPSLPWRWCSRPRSMKNRRPSALAWRWA